MHLKNKSPRMSEQLRRCSHCPIIVLHPGHGYGNHIHCSSSEIAPAAINPIQPAIAPPTRTIVYLSLFW
jgi:hypothetical protein